MLTEEYIKRMQPSLVSEDFIGKTFSVLGDSISAFSQTLTWSQDDGANFNGSAKSYYSNKGSHHFSQPDYKLMWWGYLITQLGMEIVSNNSWGGRRVSNTQDDDGFHKNTGEGFAAFHQKEIDALNKHKINFANNILNPSGEIIINTEGKVQIDCRAGIDQLDQYPKYIIVKNPDFIFIRMGINDFNSGTLLGDYDGTTPLKTYDYTPLQEKTVEEYKNFSFAYATMLDRITKTYPNSKIFCCTLSPCNRTGGEEAVIPNHFPVLENLGRGPYSLRQWNERIRQLAKAFGARIVEQENCGINYFNFNNTMIDVGEKTEGTPLGTIYRQGLHPNELGQKMMGEAAVKALLYN